MENLEKIQDISDLISGQRVAMLTTLNPDGTLHTRPMWTLNREFDGELWFFTRNSSPKASELERDSHVSVSYIDSQGDRYVVVNGTGELVHDRERIRQFWNPAFAAWIPRGAEDPDLSLIRIAVDRAEYWDSATNRMVPVSHAARSRVA